MLTCIDVKFIFNSVRLGLSIPANILQIADVALRVVNQNNSTSSPGLLGNGASTCSGLHF